MGVAMRDDSYVPFLQSDRLESGIADGRYPARAAGDDMIPDRGPGVTSLAICAPGGASATHGDLAVTSKKTDPDKRTAERTSDNASVLIGMTSDTRLGCPRAGLGE